MSVVGDFTIPAKAFALEEALSTAPEMTIEADRLASHSPKEVFPFFWATGSNFERFYQALEDDPTVTEVSVASESENEVLYRLKWSDKFCSLIHEMVDYHASIMEAKAQGDHWNLRLRFANEGMVSSFQNHFRETRHRFDVNKLYHPTGSRQGAFGLTREQHEALVTAVNAGYFSVPRTASTEEVSDELGISANAVSERIRRGCETLVRSGLFISDDIE